MVIFFRSAQLVWYILTNFPAFSANKPFLILDHSKSYIEKMHSIYDE